MNVTGYLGAAPPRWPRASAADQPAGGVFPGPWDSRAHVIAFGMMYYEKAGGLLAVATKTIVSGMDGKGC